MSELFNGHGWRVTLESVVLPNGSAKTQAMVHRCDSVHILALPTPSTVLVLREFRPFMNQWRWMLPAGKMDKPGEAPLEAAQRELREETGFRAQVMRPFCSCRTSENVNQENHLFIAEGLVKDPLPMEEYEMIEVHELPLEEAAKRVLDQQPLHTLSAFGLLRYLREVA